MLTLTEQRGHMWELTTHLKNMNIRKPRWSNSLVPPSTDNSQCTVRVPVNRVWTRRMLGRRPLLRKHHNLIFFDLWVGYQLVVQEALALCPESSTGLKILGRFFFYHWKCLVCLSSYKKSHNTNHLLIMKTNLIQKAASIFLTVLQKRNTSIVQQNFHGMNMNIFSDYSYYRSCYLKVDNFSVTDVCTSHTWCPQQRVACSSSVM